jgi:hypothetical protein
MRAVILILIPLAAGCFAPGRAPDRFSQAQLNAIETREVDADVDRTFEAGTDALLDAGYTIVHSDKNAGILTGARVIDRTVQRIFISSMISDSQYTLTLLVKRLGPVRSSARIKLAHNGEARVDKKAIDDIWVLMQRQVLMNEPPAVDLESAGK